MIPSAALDVVAFCALGAMSETQQLSFTCIEAMGKSDPEKVFAETLCMVATVTARTATRAFATTGESRVHLSEALLALPVTLHSYIAGGEVLRGGEDPVDRNLGDTSDLDRMLHFYGTHIAEGQRLDRKALRHVMLLWMGRISSPGLNEHPEQRLERLELVDRMSDHVRLIDAFARNASEAT